MTQWHQALGELPGLSLLSKNPEMQNETAAYCPAGFIPLLLPLLKKNGHVLYVAKDEKQAEELFESLRFFEPDALFFPEIDVIPYTQVFPSQDKLADRSRVLDLLIREQHARVIVASMASALRVLPPQKAYMNNCLEFKKGAEIDGKTLFTRLARMGYTREFKVSIPGYFSSRGDIIDLFSPNSNLALRINLFGDEIESMRLFDPLRQTSIKDIDYFKVIPLSEFFIPKEYATDERISMAGLHSDFPDFYTRTVTLADYSSMPLLTVMPDEWKDYEEQEHNNVALYSPENMSSERLLSRMEKWKSKKRLFLTKVTGPNVIDTGIRPGQQGEGGFSSFSKNIAELLKKPSNRAFLFVEYRELAERLAKLLSSYPVRMVTIAEDLEGKGLTLVIANLQKSFVLPREDGADYFFSESDLSGKKRAFRRRIKQIETMIEDIEEIEEGEYVVHLNYGIGRFEGIQKLNVLGTAKDYILICYDEDEKLFVPLEQAGLIGKYVGTGGKKPKLDSLDSKSWAKKKARVEASVREFAQRLVTIYARREAMKGHAFPPDTVWQRDFEEAFPYIETPDQIKVIEEIKKDMENKKPMDRLLCGDVGFGKTEVAMRAAFKAVMDGRQVAMIAPTTVLTEQHYLSFLERFRGFPVKIAMVSRFTSAREWTEIKKKIAVHELDILVGTHKLFSKELVFHALGLVVIDEEHKFGVSHKETLKERHPGTDFLSLSATPIPRTLNLALSEIRDISLLQTPPELRVPVETVVSDFNWDVVKYAIEKELERGGQVFFVHNTIKRLPEYAFHIERLIPKAKCSIGHGQMHEEDLEEAFIGFVKGHYNVFVCTTIIDSGLDIPNANTMIISDAHKFGLSQLYQLKGRVGRSEREGYAYFLYPRDKALTENAQKRLFVINEYTNLGAGFQIAMKDLEIRGAGNILGAEQHGNIISVGYELYTRMLREEVEKLKGREKTEAETLIDLNYHAYIPDDYISEPAYKMEIYKKMLSVKSENEIRALSLELNDRFGRIPDEVMALFAISRLKIKAGEMGISSLIEKGKFIEISFSKYSKVSPIKVMNALQVRKHPISVKPHLKDTIFYEKFESSIEIKVKRLMAFLEDVRE